MPSRSGIVRSITTTSGFSRSAMATASRPFGASPTTWMSRAALSTALSPSRTTLWSSASTTRIMPSLIRCSSLIPGEVAYDGHHGRDPRPHAWRAVDLESPPGERNPFAHGEQSHTGTPPFRLEDVEAAPVVDHVEHDAAVAHREAELGAIGAGMLQHVVHGGLGDAI